MSHTVSGSLTVTLTSGLSSRKISPVKFEVGTPKIWFGDTSWGPQSVPYCFWVTVTLTSSISSRKNHVQSRSPIIFPNWFVCGYILGSQCHILFLGHCDLELTSSFSSIKSYPGDFLSGHLCNCDTFLF